MACGPDTCLNADREDNLMKILLAAVNAKYIHSNLAVYCLKSYAASKGYPVEIAEYTINQQPEEVLRDLYGRRADVVAFSCYIWNIDFVKAVIKDYKKVCPQCEVWLGGPEVSYRGEVLLQELPEVRGIMVGEGEEIFARLVARYKELEEAGRTPGIEERTSERNSNGTEVRKLRYNDIDVLAWQEIPGIVVRLNNETIRSTKQAPPLDFSRLPFPYGDGSVSVSEESMIPDVFENRIVYYESSRGCPFSCAYCLSSIDKRVRFREMELVKQELAFFLKKKVPQVKFIDRTFNVNGPRTMELLQFIKENDNGITNFHFEIAAELLTEEQTALLNTLRPGLVQLEIGVQSTNEETLHTVCRKTELSVLKEKVAAVREKNNVHIHLDLIAGLPKENLASFKNSFNEVYRMRPHQLQLGFLKVLSGAPMEQMAEENEIVYQSAPPYEVLSTRWLAFEDIILLKKVEELAEVYYNSGQFIYSMIYLQHFFEAPFDLFEQLAFYYEEKKLLGMKISRIRRYEILLEFVKDRLLLKTELETELPVFGQILFYDFCLREKPKSCPSFGRCRQLDKQKLKEIYLSLGVKREEEGMHDVEEFSFNPVATAEQGSVTGEACHILFSYEKREAMFGQADIKIVTVQS